MTKDCALLDCQGIAMKHFRSIRLSILKFESQLCKMFAIFIDFKILRTTSLREGTRRMWPYKTFYWIKENELCTNFIDTLRVQKCGDEFLMPYCRKILFTSRTDICSDGQIVWSCRVYRIVVKVSFLYKVYTHLVPGNSMKVFIRAHSPCIGLILLILVTTTKIYIYTYIYRGDF